MTEWLLLIPTQFEHGIVSDSISKFDSAAVEICGFGPVVSAARTAQLIAKHQPQRVLLLGIAGSYDDELSVGMAFQFSDVACYGVGVGTGEAFQTAKQMGWSHWHGTEDCEAITDNICLESNSSRASSQLLTVCSASQNALDVADRRQAFPNAVAEDMEGFAVAAACRLADVPLAIVRGISNVAGERDKETWKINEALNAAVELAAKIVGAN